MSKISSLELAERMQALEDKIRRLLRDLDDTINNIDSGMLGEELERRIKTIENRLTALEDSSNG